MEETKELQTMYKIFRCLIYLSLIVEFFEYAIDPALLDYWGGIVCDIHSRVKRWFILYGWQPRMEQDCYHRAYLYHLHWHPKQETFGV